MWPSFEDFAVQENPTYFTSSIYDQKISWEEDKHCSPELRSKATDVHLWLDFCGRTRPSKPSFQDANFVPCNKWVSCQLAFKKEFICHVTRGFPKGPSPNQHFQFGTIQYFHKR